MNKKEWLKRLIPNMESFTGGVHVILWAVGAILAMWFLIVFGAYLVAAFMVIFFVCLCGQGNKYSHEIREYFVSKVKDVKQEWANKPNSDNSEEHD